MIVIVAATPVAVVTAIAPVIQAIVGAVEAAKLRWNEIQLEESIQVVVAAIAEVVIDPWDNHVWDFMMTMTTNSITNLTTNAIIIDNIITNQNHRLILDHTNARMIMCNGCPTIDSVGAEELDLHLVVVLALQQCLPNIMPMARKREQSKFMKKRGNNNDEKSSRLQ